MVDIVTITTKVLKYRTIPTWTIVDTEVGGASEERHSITWIEELVDEDSNLNECIEPATTFIRKIKGGTANLTASFSRYKTPRESTPQRL